MKIKVKRQAENEAPALDRSNFREEFAKAQVACWNFSEVTEVKSHDFRITVISVKKQVCRFTA